MLRLQLDASASFLRLRVDGDNRVGRHRLRMLVATGVERGVTLADAAFHPVVRTVPEVPAAEQRMERVVPTAPLHRWVSRYDDGGGATLFSDGLAEYEDLNDGVLAATLLRCVDELSRPDLPERPGHAGWPAAVPDAACIGSYGASFALALLGARTAADRDAIERLADDVLLPITGETLRSNILPPKIVAGLTLEGEGLAFSAAMPARREGWIVLRCVNRRDERVGGRWRLSGAVAEALRGRLDETPLGALVVDDGVIEFEAAPGEIVTVLVRR
jgi:Alpha-mannosidase